MTDLILLAAVQSTVPDTVRWSWTGSAIIIGASLVILFIASRTIRFPQVGPKMPLPFPALFNNPSVGTVLGSVSLGHIVGIGIILGLNNLGILK
ncbi:photosystem I reaction center subunit PsaK [Chroococcidiopsis sp. TS-821]|uniref:Photosystem I reaction center subunit PsaK n=1 Tax=Chroococcidiopsis sp. TS-821 TaxID=1378066 RepID=A0ACD6BA62_9CYAN|nr:photosystem I reaction center subunit PsaK [Chroococcidiopsis sp. TS-821]7QCO_K Chain K, Photosystem I reaction center subunit PsaK [Chroococcidiopsis sp. TS-821]7QCO_R Chain R, Photosystem I reaction center subunit PsaK [Chroococcidiopsis sp. TS-821]7QCO_k Chain k, Photosystem I reaction center subunit PsaK [Chroococcidiopsis sp. TS-821]7QCO_r Chain r, Photosystem I reaction center subunit PsaK [Chroococcidiopsis sp. TS-821]PPS40354.1 photosystem I reaction center subunit PsaK [Chroococcid